MTDMLQKAVDRLLENAASCVVLRPGEKAYISNGKGIGPLMDALSQNENALRDAVIADKVVGKAIALVAIYGGAKAIYGQVMSQNAIKVLTANGLEFAFGQLVPYIENRAKNGYCPMEKSVLDTDDPAAAFPALAERLRMLRSESDTSR